MPAAPGLRCDHAVVRFCELLARGTVDRAAKIPLWDLGLGELIELKVAELGIPQTPLSVVSVARELGILRKVSHVRR